MSDALGMNGGSSLTAVVHEDHEKLRTMLRDAAGAVDDPADPRRTYALCDTFLAALSQHLAVVEDVVYPVVREQPHGRTTATAQVHAARGMERVMRRVEGSLYGDWFAIDTPRERLWDEMAAVFESHVQDEERLTTGLDRQLDQPHRDELIGALGVRAGVAPTRPHPHSPHSKLAGRLTHRLWSLADRAMDAMDNRMLPHKAGPPHPARTSRWTQYLLGRARFGARAESDRDRPADRPESG